MPRNAVAVTAPNRNALRIQLSPIEISYCCVPATSSPWGTGPRGRSRPAQLSASAAMRGLLSNAKRCGRQLDPWLRATPLQRSIFCTYSARFRRVGRRHMFNVLIAIVVGSIAKAWLQLMGATVIVVGSRLVAIACNMWLLSDAGRRSPQRARSGARYRAPDRRHRGKSRNHDPTLPAPQRY